MVSGGGLGGQGWKGERGFICLETDSSWPINRKEPYCEPTRLTADEEFKFYESNGFVTETNKMRMPRNFYLQKKHLQWFTQL